MSMATATRAITAFLDGPDDTSIRNVIHSTEGAREFGFPAPLVGGVTVYGWSVPAILGVLGEGWLSHGWADIHFRRPVYPGDVITASVAGTAERAELALSNQEGQVCIRGEVGLGRAPWLAELAMPAALEAQPALEQRPRLTPESAPVGLDLRPMAVPFPAEEVAAYARDLQQDDSSLWCGPGGRIHPAQLAARMTPLLHHSFEYGPAIHARSQVQHLAPALAGQVVTVAGKFIDAYERNGHQYGVVDGVVIGEAGGLLARIRHTTIYQVARR